MKTGSSPEPRPVPRLPSCLPAVVLLFACGAPETPAPALSPAAPPEPGPELRMTGVRMNMIPADGEAVALTAERADANREWTRVRLFRVHARAEGGERGLFLSASTMDAPLDGTGAIQLTAPGISGADGMALRADEGVWDRAAGRMEMRGNLRLRQDSQGFTLHAQAGVFHPGGKEGQLGGPVTGARGGIRFEGRELLFRNGGARVELSGGVVVTSDHGVIRCERLSATALPGGGGRWEERISSAACEGSASIASGDWNGTANRIGWNPRASLMTLEGDPVVTGQGVDIRGERIAWDQPASRFTVSRPVIHAQRGAAGGAVQARAADLVWSAATKTGEFTGGAQLTERDTTIECDRMEVTLDDQNQASQLHGKDNVRIRRGRIRAQSGELIYERSGQEIVLTGRPELRDGGSVIRGEAIRWNRSTGDVRVEKARAHIESGDAFGQP
ncbi:MAG: Lipopolysaccharide export system protein LptA [Myxococcota bacterium]|nr:Lipopolysaccharide export system protein LptA [Myxococcota bacterium]